LEWTFLLSRLKFVEGASGVSLRVHDRDLHPALQGEQADERIREAMSG
jgi:hypothetical protein